jgi:hypothetical protein
MKDYLENFKARNVNGKKLAIIDMSDLNDLVGSNLSHKLLIYKSINNLIQMVRILSKRASEFCLSYTKVFKFLQEIRPTKRHIAQPHLHDIESSRRSMQIH